MFRTILVGTDGSPTADNAVSEAISIAAALDARLLIVSAYEPVADPRPPEERGRPQSELPWAVGPPREEALPILDEAAVQAREAGVGLVETFARQGDAADALIDIAEEQSADLIVVGNLGMTGAKRFLLGSVPNKVSHHAPCSVLIVRAS